MDGPDKPGHDGMGLMLQSATLRGLDTFSVQPHAAAIKTIVLLHERREADKQNQCHENGEKNKEHPLPAHENALHDRGDDPVGRAVAVHEGLDVDDDLAAHLDAAFDGGRAHMGQ